MTIIKHKKIYQINIKETISPYYLFTGSAIAPASVIVNAGKVLTLSANSKLLIDLKHFKLLVKHTGGLLIKKTATLRQVKTSDTNYAPIVNYILTDHLGSTNVATDNTGAIAETLDYYPFGAQRIASGSYAPQRQYVGQFFDTDTSLNYLNARYYQNTTGRFISEDPMFWNFDQAWLIDPQNQNAYAYARNNPATLSDPDGKSWLMRLFGSQQNSVASPYQSTQNSNTQNINLGSSSWVSQYSLPNPGGACLRACNQISGYISDSSRSINMATYDNNRNLNTLSGNTGVDTINNYLLNGQKVTVGVNRGDGNENMTTPNHASEHFISINGKYTDNGKTYYTFLDPGTHSQESGTSSSNKLYLNSNGSLTGGTAYNKNYHYTVTEVRLK